MYKYLLSLIVLCPLTTSYAQISSYQLAKNGHVGFYIKKFAIKILEAEFQQIDSRVDFDATHLAQSHIAFTMKVDSLKLSNDSLHDMVLGPDVFNAQQYKDIVFESTDIQNKGAYNYNVLGNLTIKGKTKPVVFETQIIPTAKENQFTFKAHTEIQSHNFAMKSKFGSLTEHVNIFVDGELISK
ncbi:YceI family protein [Acinetobacter boissieri]|uniref:Polyisoprenoid-binding protein YceI n=1 Tax=Acinetobacter boissieri TaxID=1219383 RepID=A0A1G6IG72_9GAMM|nr:YceI family protein [Acinetobacter boissieri]SDC05471.1 Polyisoprenoid-binding protein YceI [Acinetobacter boissieri]